MLDYYKICSTFNGKGVVGFVLKKCYDWSGKNKNVDGIWLYHGQGKIKKVMGYDYIMVREK